MAKKKTNIENGFDTAVELTQKTAKTTLNSAVDMVEVSEEYVQGVYKAGYDANVDALKVAKGYWDAATDIRKDWVKLIEKSGESVIDATAKMEIPMQKEAYDFGKSVVEGVTSTFERFVPQTK